MELKWRNVDIEVKNKNQRYKSDRIKLVSDACGGTKSGLLAIMGPSGSGKTTLLKALAGRIPEGSLTTGIIELNGEERTFNKWKNRIGYVDQDDDIFESLTVRESITYAAKFRLKRKTNIVENIENLCKKIGITHIIDCKMANISGGERKRVMLAIELISEPEIIFLDEPTSGLDNHTTLNIVKLLKDLSKEGKLIIFSIHQPDNMTAAEFDNILLLSQGRSVYMGPMDKCEPHLISHGFDKDEKESFSNFAMKILSVEPGVYHETANTTKLNGLVEEVKKNIILTKIIKIQENQQTKYPILFQDLIIYAF